MISMATVASHQALPEPGSNATSGTARDAARVVLRLLLAGLLLLPVYALLTVDRALVPRLIVLAVFCLSVLRPGGGLLACAALLVVSPSMSGLLQSEVQMGEPMLLAFLAGWLLHDTFRRPAPLDRDTRALVVPALLLAAVVAASVLVQLSVQQVFVDYPWGFLRAVIADLSADYVRGDRFHGLAPGGMMLEGIGLFVAAVILARRDAPLARRLLVMSALGAAAVAALNLYRYAEICLRSPAPWAAFVENMRAVRVSAVFADFNAAGSYLAMMALVAGGLAIAARRMRIGWAIGAALMLAALWLTGSRTALLAVPAAVVIAISVAAFWSRALGWKRAAVVILAVFLATGAATWLFPYDTGQRQVKDVIQGRVLLARAALDMARDYPAFGVGVGRFRTMSSSYILWSYRPAIPSENAHNNYLQLLTELGLAGFVPFLAILAVVLRRFGASLAVRTSPDLFGLGAGLVAFLLTCLAGHPLLVREVSAAFWLALGIAAAVALERCAPVVAAPSPARTWLLACLVGCLVVSVPIRAREFVRNEADLSAAAIGFSKWQFDGHGTRYRTMEERAQFYIPGATCDMKLGMQVEADGAALPIAVEISVEGRPGNRIEVVPGVWRQARANFPAASGHRFLRVDLRSAVSRGVRLRVARPVLTDCRGNRL